METLIVNLYGAPGAGKSSGAAYIFYQLKQHGINCEMVTEYAKDKVWEQHNEVFKDQCYIFGHQHFRMSRLIDKVDVIITDSPLMLGAYYSPDIFKKELTSIALKSFTNPHFNFFIKRVKKYNPKGRFQTESESDKVSEELNHFLTENNINFTVVEGNEKGYDSIVKCVLDSIALSNTSEEKSKLTLDYLKKVTKEEIKFLLKNIRSNNGDIPNNFNSVSELLFYDVADRLEFEEKMKIGNENEYYQSFLEMWKNPSIETLINEMKDECKKMGMTV